MDVITSRKSVNHNQSFWVTVEAASLIFMSGHGSAIPSAMEGKSKLNICNLLKS